MSMPAVPARPSSVAFRPHVSTRPLVASFYPLLCVVAYTPPFRARGSTPRTTPLSTVLSLNTGFPDLDKGAGYRLTKSEKREETALSGAVLVLVLVLRKLHGFGNLWLVPSPIWPFPTMGQAGQALGPAESWSPEGRARTPCLPLFRRLGFPSFCACVSVSCCAGAHWLSKLPRGAHLPTHVPTPPVLSCATSLQ